jgi:glycosyltransferase involved in cell wall biosynthesis
MKVMIISSLYYPNIIGGAEKSVQVIAENLKKFNIEPVVVSTGQKDSVDYVNGIKAYYVFHSNTYWSFYSKIQNPFLKYLWHLKSLYNSTILKKVSKIIETEKPDVINTNNLSEFSVGIWRLAKKKNIPLVHTLRDFSLLCPRATLFRRKDICRKKNLICVAMLSFRRIFSKYPDAVVGNSRFAIDIHLGAGFFKSSKKYVIYNSLESENIIKKIKDSGSIKFGYIGLLSYHKGTEFLLNAFKESNAADLHLFGRGITTDYENYLKERYKSERITFHGFVKTGEAFKIIDVLIVPSLCYDSLPRVIYEAYSSGVPVIGSNRGGTPEIIDAGKTGYVYNPDSAEDLLEKVQIFLNKPEIIEEMSLNCLKKAEDFLPDSVLKKYISIYNDVIKNNKDAVV